MKNIDTILSIFEATIVQVLLTITINLQVKGLICRLINVKDMKNATSLEVTAGGKVNHLLALVAF